MTQIILPGGPSHSPRLALRRHQTCPSALDRGRARQGPSRSSPEMTITSSLDSSTSDPNTQPDPKPPGYYTPHWSNRISGTASRKSSLRLACWIAPRNNVNAKEDAICEKECEKALRVEETSLVTRICRPPSSRHHRMLGHSVELTRAGAVDRHKKK